MYLARAFRFIVLLPLALPACDKEPTLHERTSDFVREINNQAAIACECWEAEGYDSYSECTGNFGYFGPSTQACYEDALGRDEDAAASWLDCVLELEGNYTECLDARLSCTDDDSADPCLDDYYVGYDACVQLPETIQRGLESCSPQE